ncbi:MAG: InlB B-repeat-containing protein [Erysipelotrichia bacterium]|jgi:uncharacterized repeat protein (TIGR02543 family)|nr:InlB B-repeat-containing protein [Erysipelotrichia bacterium]
MKCNCFRKSLFASVFLITLLLSSCGINSNGTSSSSTTSDSDTNTGGTTEPTDLTDSTSDSTTDLTTTEPTDTSSTDSSTDPVIEYTITFDSQGGTPVESITLPAGSYIFAPVPPTKIGYLFVNWFISLSSSTPYVFTTMPAESFTLYAKWSLVEYTITYVLNGGENANNPHSYTIETPTIMLLEPTKVENAFLGWYNNINLQGDSITKIEKGSTGNRIFYAKWSVNQYTISFNSNGGTDVSEITVDYNTSINAPPPPTKDDYRFVSWCFDESLTEVVEWPLIVTRSLRLHAAWNEKVNLKPYLVSLLDGYKLNPYSFIPETMQPASKIRNVNGLVNDYSSFVNVSDISYEGFGEQWQMVLDNLEQSLLFFNVLSVVEGVSSASIVAFNNYLDSNPSDSSHFEFEYGIYNVTINFENNVIFYILDYTTELPLLGEQVIQIYLSYNIVTLEKTGRIQLGSANALKYKSTKDHYEFAIKYLGVRRAYFEVSRNLDDSIEGRIFEYLGVDGVYSYGTSAQFYIDDDYVTTIGNKASGFPGFTGTVNELYKVSNGKLLGYAIKETLSFVTFNTYWFNLDDTTGINTIQIEEAPTTNLNPHYIYVNGSSNVFVAKKVGGLSAKTTSRRYDIELRKRYFYYEDEGEIKSLTIEAPMLFVQMEQIDTLSTDIVSSNSSVVTSFGLDISYSTMTKIKNDYDILLSSFVAQKDEFSAGDIIDIIGEPYAHTI